MHELSITTDMVQAINERLIERQIENAKRVVLEIGVLTAVLPDAVRFCFDLCAKGTRLEGACLDIREIMAQGTCKRCENLVETAESVFLCSCGSAEILWKKGLELKIKEIEVA